MNIVDTIFRARKTKNVVESDRSDKLPTMLRSLGADDTTRDDFNRALRAGVEPVRREEGDQAMIPTQPQAGRPDHDDSGRDDAETHRAAEAGTSSESFPVVDRPHSVEDAVEETYAGIQTTAGEMETSVSAGMPAPSGDDAIEATLANIDEDEAMRLVEEHAADLRREEEGAGSLSSPAQEEFAGASAYDIRYDEAAIDDPVSASAPVDVAPFADAPETTYGFEDDASEEPAVESFEEARLEHASDDFDRDEFSDAEPAYAEAAHREEERPAPSQRFGSPRLAEFAAFRAITSDMEDKLQAFSETVALSRLTFSSMQPFLEQFEADIQIADEVERERNILNGEISDVRRALEVAQRELSSKLVALTAANDRNSELRIELEQRRQNNQELAAKLDRTRSEMERLTSENANARAEIVKLVAALERESAEKDSYYQARLDLANKYAKLQQTEAQTRNKFLEATLQNDKLTKMQPALVAEQEKLRNELRVAQREKAELQNRLLAAQDQAMQLESEIQALQGHSASEAYAARTELEMHKSQLRTSEKAIVEAEARTKDLQKQLRESEVARQAAENQIATVQGELEAARRERSEAAFKLSDVNLKYMTDLLSLDQQREQNKEFQYNIDALLADKRRMAKFETLYKAAESQIVSLKEKLGLLAENLKDTTDPERLRQSIEIIGELSNTQIPANTDTPPRSGEGGKKSATH